MVVTFTHGPLYDFKRCDEFARLIVQSMPSGFEAPDHPSFVVFGEGSQNLGKLVTIFLLWLHGDFYLHRWPLSSSLPAIPAPVASGGAFYDLTSNTSF
jgi:hypothetical protein